MKKFWQKVLLLPYKSNSQDNPLHENQVRELLEEDYVIITKQEFEDEFDHDWDGFLLVMVSINQMVINNTPDFRVKDERAESH